MPIYPVSDIVSPSVSLCTLSSVCPAPRAEVLDTEGRALALATMTRRTTSPAPLVQGAPAPPPAVNALFSVPRPDRTAQRPWTQTRKAQRSARSVGSVLQPSLEAGCSSIDAVSEQVPGSVAQQAALVRDVGSMVSVAIHLEEEVPWRQGTSSSRWMATDTMDPTSRTKAACCATEPGTCSDTASMDEHPASRDGCSTEPTERAERCAFRVWVQGRCAVRSGRGTENKALTAGGGAGAPWTSGAGDVVRRVIVASANARPSVSRTSARGAGHTEERVQRDTDGDTISDTG